jgi:monoamine oxidase
VIEARDRIGGRIHTDRSFGFAVDLGASWIHGVTGNPLVDVASRLGMRTVGTSYASGTLFGIDGKRRRDEGKLEDRFAAILKAIDDELDDDTPDGPLGDALRRRVAELPADQQRDLAYEWNAAIEQEYAASIDELSLEHWDDDDEDVGGDVLLPDGYDALPIGLAKGIEVRLGTVVTRIARDGAAVRVSTSHGELAAGKVVVTVPVSVLGSIDFAPALAADKLAALAHIGMGLLDKCYLRFDRAFWAADDTDWIGRIPPSPGEWDEWLNLQRSLGQPVLLGFNAATFARSLEQRDDAAIVAGALAALRTCYPDVPAPTGTLITRWAADPFSLGSYSFLRPGGSPKDREALAAPLDRALYFAGEATVTDHPSTVRGAYVSGQRAATEVLAG